MKPPGAQTGILLALADGDAQAARVGSQVGGRVGVFVDIAGNRGDLLGPAA